MPIIEECPTTLFFRFSTLFDSTFVTLRLRSANLTNNVLEALSHVKICHAIEPREKQVLAAETLVGGPILAIKSSGGYLTDFVVTLFQAGFHHVARIKSAADGGIDIFE